MDKDIDTFVNERKTGSDRPAPVPYVNYYQPAQIVPEPTTGKGGGRTEGGIPIREAPNKELPPIPVEVDTARGGVGGGGGGGEGGMLEGKDTKLFLLYCVTNFVLMCMCVQICTPVSLSN